VLHRRKQLTEIEVRYYMRQILEGVRYIHEQRIVHRDLKLENFFLSDQMAVKIGDFGLAETLALRARRKSICGTPNYMAPEIFTSKEGYSYEVDTWSLGVIAFLLLCGRYPFEDPDAIATQLKRGLTFPSRLSE
jgi:serine/threonine protein kinase